VVLVDNILVNIIVVLVDNILVNIIVVLVDNILVNIMVVLVDIYWSPLLRFSISGNEVLNAYYIFTQPQRIIKMLLFKL
jgi:hypothetical protein